MATRADLINQFKSMISDRRDYANKTKKYIEQKKAFKEAQKNFKKSIANGEQSVGGGSFTKNPALEKNIRQVNAYNKALTERGNEAVSKLESDLDKIDKFKNWQELHKGEIQAYNRFFDRRSREIQEQIDMVDEAMVAANNREDWDEYSRLYKIYRKLSDEKIKLDEMETPESAMKMRFYDLPWEVRDLLQNGNIPERELSARANRITEVGLPNIDNITKSNVDDIIRFHTTAVKNLPYIYKNGLRADMGGKGYGRVLLGGRRGATSNDIGGVYTTSRHPFDVRDDVEYWRFADTYTPDEGHATLQLNIPKKDYRKLDRMDSNPEEVFGGVFNREHGSLLQTIQNGGRTDIFEKKLKPTYIKKAIGEDGESFDIEDFIKNYQCYDDCDDWYKALTKTGLAKYDPELETYDWNEPLFEELRNRK